MSIIENEKVKKYIDEVCKEIKNKKVHSSIRDELVSHIEEIVDMEVERCESKDKAIEKAILKMGNSEEVGKNLDKVHKAKPDYLLLGLTAALMLIGIFTLWFMGNNAGSENPEFYGNFARNTVIFSLIGATFAFAIIKGDYRDIKRFSKKIYIASIALMFFTVFTSRTINGARGFISIGPFTINSSYISAFLLIISLAGIFDNYDWKSRKNIIKGLALGFGPIIILAKGHSFGTVIIYGIAVVAIMMISGIKVKYMISSIMGLAGILSMYILGQPYRAIRIKVFINSEQYPYSQGWIYNQLKIIRNSSGLFLQSEPLSFKVLPEIHGEFILTYIMYSFGFIACTMLITLVSLFILRIGFIGAKAKNSYGKLLVSGLCVFFVVQFLINIFMNFNLFPIMGMPMPFISYSGSNMLVSVISISIITSVYKWRNTPFNIA